MLSGSLLDIDSNSNSKKDFDSNKYEKCTSLVDVRNKVRELLKFKRVKSNWIKDKVLIAITKNFRNITKQFLESYILKTIENFRKTYYKNWVKYTKKQSVHANFTQREDYNWIELEEQLLSHY